MKDWCYTSWFFRCGFDSNILRFSARLIIENGNLDKTRKFVVSYFLSDDTILVNLIPEQNTGTPKRGNKYVITPKVLQKCTKF